MYLLQINIETRVIIGISAMVILFTSFIIAFVISQRKKLQYHKNVNALNEEQQQILTKQNELLEEKVLERTSELLQQKETLQQLLNELKATQSQLVQREKMASLGELTAGIAHEIQNPLNFVNNFSEVNMELIDELKIALHNEEKENALSLSDNIKENEMKIIFHGQRADAIVKGMLQHSRISTGQKVLTDINALTDEFLHLSYHGLRAKDKTFNAVIKTDYDKTIEKISVVPQDAGRVFLNLFNNAFYAVTEKKKNTLQKDYEPTVWVSTKKVGDNIEISVKDNGNGIPQKLRDKIFQPFFTTKPAGQGTGLGLSLSYDIITKGHGGTLSVVTEDGSFAEFIVKLPLK
jgi:signal transduction histidine kinase